MTFVHSADGDGAEGAGADGISGDGIGAEGVGVEGVGAEGVSSDGIDIIGESLGAGLSLGGSQGDSLGTVTSSAIKIGAEEVGQEPVLEKLEHCQAFITTVSVNCNRLLFLWNRSTIW